MKKQTYEIPQNWNNEFCDFLRETGFDSYGCMKDTTLQITTRTGKTDEMEGFENDVFSIFPYYWGEDDELSHAPNFIYKPTGLEMSWYKYPFRGAYMNQDITFSQLEEIITLCTKSIKENKGFPTRVEAIDAQIKLHQSEIHKHQQAIDTLQKQKEQYLNQ